MKIIKRMLFISCLLLTLLLLASCENIEDDDYSIEVSPAGGFVWDDSIQIEVSATNVDELEKVQLFIDGTLYEERFFPPFVFIWETEDYKMSTHAVIIKASYINKVISSNPIIYKIYPVFPEDLNNFVGITETDEDGELIGNIDDDDWIIDTRENTQNSRSVIISSFTAIYSNGSPIINWVTQSESDNIGWNVYRSDSNNFGQAQILNLNTIPGNGTTSEPYFYSFTDEYEVQENSTYWYWLESISGSGETESFGPVSLTILDGEIPELPNQYQFGPAFPNPTNVNWCDIPIAISENNIGYLIIISQNGDILHSNNFEQGTYTYDWDCTDEFGNDIESGQIYRFIFHVEDEVHSHGDVLVE